MIKGGINEILGAKINSIVQTIMRIVASSEKRRIE